MKKVAIFVFTVFSLFILSTSYLLASDEGVTSLRDARENLIQAQKELREAQKTAVTNRQIENTERRASIAATLSSIRKERTRNYFNQMISRLEAFVDRLEKLTQRIEDRITKIEAEDKDAQLSSAKEDILQAKDNLTLAKSNIAEAKVSMETVLSSNKPKEAFDLLKAQIKVIKESLVETHQLLVHSIGVLKGLRVGNSTPTPTN